MGFVAQRPGVGLDWGGLDIDVAIRPDHWCFVDDARIVNEGIDRREVEVGAERRWDRRWNKDWDKLEKLQRP